MRYLLFAWENYEATGGMTDLADKNDSIDKCIESFKILMKRMDFEYYHIYDTVENKIVKKGDWSDFRR